MTAWDAEGSLAGLTSSVSNAINGNERGIVGAILSTTGSVKVSAKQLHITLDQQSDPSRTRVLEHLCQVISDRQTCYPGTDLKLVFEVAKQPTN